MAVILNQEWYSISNYDDKLRLIHHYQLHPEMLPFIGKHYPNSKIIILGESHYLSNDELPETKALQNWYNQPTSNYKFKYPTNFDTRKVVHNYLIGHRTKAYTMFSNPAKALINGWNLKNVNDSEAFTAFTFFNYFQRPANISGNSISLNLDDEKQAAAIFSKVVDILKPTKVIFLSKKAFNSYCRQTGTINNELVDFVYHPTCPYWNSDNGDEKLFNIFSSLNPYKGFNINGTLHKDKTADILAETYQKIEKHQKRFRNDSITYRIYTESSNSDMVCEIVWYLTDKNKRFGIGYVIKTRNLWIWDYSIKQYISDEEIRNYPKLVELYMNVLRLINQL